MPGRVQKFFSLIGLLKYGIVLSLILIYLPLTAIFTGAPGHGITGNMFVELSPRGVLFAMMFLLAVAWSVMFTEGLIVNGAENRANKAMPVYRRMAQIENIMAQLPQNKTIPHWADVFFAVPVTGWQFLFFTIVLAGPSFAVIVWRADQPVLALLISLLAFVIDYVAFIVVCTPAALLDAGDPPLRGFPLAEKIWSWFGYRPDAPSQNTWAYRFSRRLWEWITVAVRKLRLSYLLDPASGLIYPVHFLSIVIASVLLFLWLGFDWIAYPGRLDIESAPVVYIYASLLLFVWLFAALNFHLGRQHISSLAALLIVVLAGYMILDVDHDYHATRETAPLTPLTPVDSAKGQGGANLVVVASAGGGIWAAGWTGLALEKLVGARPELAREIRLLSTVSGGSVGAANYVQALLNDQAYRKGGPVSAATLRSVRLKSVTSSLEAAAYGVAFRDFPRLVTGGLYNVQPDRGYLLEHEWARIAAGTIEPDERIEKGAAEDGKCWAGVKKCGFLHLAEFIRDGTVPAVIFNATVMELGRRIMITPLDFAANDGGRRRGQTLSDFLFTDEKSGAVAARANLPFWTAARLSATFSFVSPAVRTNVVDKKNGEEDRNLWRQHIVDGGYYDNYGVASALDWLEPVLEARRDGAAGLNFSKVLIIQLRGFAEKPEAEMKPSPGAKAALIGPLDAIFAIREGVAITRNLIDVDRFIDRWNRELKGQVELKSVDFVPGIEQTGGPLSWHLSKADINNLKDSWGDGDNPAGWRRGIQESWCALADFLGAPPKMDCGAVISK